MFNLEAILPSQEILKEVFAHKQQTISANAFRKLYETTMEATRKKNEEAAAANRKKLAAIVQKLLAGIPLTATEMQFLKSNAPVYYNLALRQQMQRKNKNTSMLGMCETGSVELAPPIRGVF